MLLARARVHLSESVSSRASIFRTSDARRFDQLDEPSSPFNLPVAVAQDPGGVPGDRLSDRGHSGVRSGAGVHRRRTRRAARASPPPAAGWTGASRCFAASNRSGSTRSRARRAALPTVAVVYPRFTMIGGDFEAVRGKWGLRGEAAALRRRQLPVGRSARRDRALVRRRLGVDRRAGDYTLSGTVLVHSESYDAPLTVASRWLTGMPMSATGGPTCRWWCRPIGRLPASVIASGDSASTTPTDGVRLRSRHRDGQPSRQPGARGVDRLVRRGRP